MATQKQNLRTAKLLSRLRFGPELGALAQLFADARSQRDLSINNAKGGAASLMATLEQTRPDVENIYSRAGADRSAGFGEASAATAGLPSGGVVDAIKAGMAREAAGAGARATEARTRDLTEIDKRKGAAQQGAIYDTSQAQKRYGSDAAKLADRLRGIAGEQGAFVETQLTDLTDKQRDRAIQRFSAQTSRMSAKTSAQSAEESARHNRAQEGTSGKTAEETARHNRAMERKARKGKGGSGGLTHLQRGTAWDEIKQAASWARKLKGDGWRQGDIYDALREGRDLEDENKNKIKIPKLGHDYVNAGLDLAYKGHLTKPNKRVLHERGLSIPKRYRHHTQRG